MKTEARGQSRANSRSHPCAESEVRGGWREGNPNAAHLQTSFWINFLGLSYLKIVKGNINTDVVWQ